METPEVHAPHPHRNRRRRGPEGLPRWLELAVAVTALITSISSIVLAIGNGKAMDKLVKANSIPYLQGDFSDANLEGDKILSLDLFNRGVGPAHEKSLRVKVDQHYVRSTNELISASVGLEAAQQAHPFLPELLKNRVRTRFIHGGDRQVVFQFARTPENAQFWKRLSDAQDRWDVEFCYCSVFNECWNVTGKWAEPEPVKECRRDEAHEFFP
jgi:hypothetical protein